MIELLSSPWALSKDALNQLHGNYILAQKNKTDKKAFFDIDTDFEPQHLNIKNGVAIIDVVGVLTPEKTFFWFSRGTSYREIGDQLQAAIEDSSVREIILRLNTPGGTISGLFETSEKIREAGKIKKITAFSDGMCLSAGMPLAAACSELVLSGSAVEVGSIGVMLKKTDFTEMQKIEGISVHEFVAGKYKNSLSTNKKLNKDDSEYLQSQVDYVATIFIDEISLETGVSVEDLQAMEAKVFIGEQAIETGLASRIATLESLISAPDSPGQSSTNLNGAQAMKPEEIEAMQEENAQLKAEAEAAKTENTTAISGAVAAENKRIAGIQAIGFLGQEDLVSALVKDTKMSLGDAAIKLNQDMQEKNKQAGVDLSTSAPKSVKTVPAADTSTEQKKAEEAKVDDNSTWKQKFEASAALQHEFEGNFAAYEAYSIQNERGNVRIFGE